MAKQTFTTGQVLTAAQMTSLQQTAMLGGAASAKTASYTLVAADAGTAITMSNASATTITVNTALFAAGDTVQITNIGAGVCTITAGTATVNTRSSLALAQYEGGTLFFISTSSAIFVKGAGTAASSSPTSGFNYVSTSEATSSTSYTGLTTAQTVTVTTGTKVAVFLSFAAYRSPATANQGANATYNISGATTYTGDNSNALMMQVMPGTAEQVRYSGVDFKTVTAGSNTFTMRFAVNPGNSVTFLQRQIAVIDLGS